MKKTKKVCLAALALVLVCSGVGAAQPTEVLSGIAAALNRGDARGLSAFFNKNVEIAIEGQDNIFSNRQARGIISDFFDKNEVRSFSIIHQGERDVSCFIIGTLDTDYMSYRVYLLTRKEDDKIFIQQLRIEPSNE